MKVTIKREIEAEQWNGDHAALLPGTHVCRPEIHWSADHRYVYFTYARFRSRNWLGIDELIEPPASVGFDQVFRVSLKDGRAYHRHVLPFNMWTVKSEAQIKRDWRPLYLDGDASDALARAFADYVHLEGWFTDKMPLFAEFRITDGSYGRGFRPVYLGAGDWLVREKGKDPVAVSDDEFRKMAAA